MSSWGVCGGLRVGRSVMGGRIDVEDGMKGVRWGSGGLGGLVVNKGNEDDVIGGGKDLK